METSKLDVIIPLAIAAAAGFLFAQATRRRKDSYDHIQSVDSSCLESSSSKTYDDHELEEEILVLRSSVKEMEIRYLQYGDRKGQELMAMELEKIIFVEITRAQIMEMDASSERFQNMFLGYQKTLGLSRSRNRMLRRRVKKISRKIKEQRELIMQLHQQIEAAKAEISRNHEELCDKTEVIGKMEDEIRQLKDDLSELMIEMADKTAQSKTDEIAMETEVKHLRRSNACLKDELTRKNQEEGLKFAEIGYFGSDDDHDELGRHSGCLNLPATAITHGGAARDSRRKKLIRRLKRWVEGSDHKEKHGFEEMHIIQGRKSCSSV